MSLLSSVGVIFPLFRTYAPSMAKLSSRARVGAGDVFPAVRPLALLLPGVRYRLNTKTVRQEWEMNMNGMVTAGWELSVALVGDSVKGRELPT